jgi:hypothetical protein
MIIPFSNKVFRDRKVLEVRDCCSSSRGDRRALYDLRRRFFLYGTDNNRTEQVKFNRLQAHLDLVASFLYAADYAKYELSVGQNQGPILETQTEAMQDHWNDTFRDSGLAYMASDAMLWSLILEQSIIKIGWSNERKQLYGRLIDPAQFGVFDESETDLDNQEAFVHRYRVPWDNAVVRLLRAGKKDEIKKLGTTVGTERNEYPPVFQALMISATGGTNITGNIAGMAPATFTPVPTYEPKSDIVTVEFQEVWMWDDVHDDYVVVTIAEPDIILSDSREMFRAMEKATGDVPLRPEWSTVTNPLMLPQEHPFVPFCPFQLPGYYWGEAHCDRLIPLQRWTNERLDQISEILEMQVDPPKTFSGFMGLNDEKAGAFGGPGTWVLDQLPNAKVEPMRPEMPQDLFTEFKEIGAIFLEASGLTETVTGKGESGVRGGGHAKQLAATGSSRIRKIAVNMEQPLVKMGDLGMKLTQRNSTELLKVKSGEKFLPALYAADNWNMRISGHSHSPLFANESRELAAVLLKSKSIDREQFIRMLNPPGADHMITDVRKMMKADAEAAAQAKAQGKPPGGGMRQSKAA